MSSRRSRSGGSCDRDHVDAVEEVLAEPPFGDHLRRSWLVAAMTRMSASTSSRPPTRRNRRSCSTRSSFTCIDGLISPISSRNTVPVLGDLEQPLLVAVGAGEGAAHVAEELRFEQRLGQRAAVERHERALAPQRVEVDRPARPAPCRCPIRPSAGSCCWCGATVSIILKTASIGSLRPMMFENWCDGRRACASAARSPGAGRGSRASRGPSSSARRRRTACSGSRTRRAASPRRPSRSTRTR